MRLIDADELTDRAYRERLDSRELVAQMIESAPTIDAVPVIRCKDCVCWDTSWKPTRAIEGAYWCPFHDIITEADDYCSSAERKES